MNNVVPFMEQEEIKATSAFNFVAGAFESEKWRIPFFSSTVSFVQASNYLSLASDLSDTQAAGVGIDELYQREVDWVRVGGPLLQYLMSEQEPQFFNAITVVLMPYDDEHLELKTDFGSDVDWQAPGFPATSGYKKTLNVGPISFGFYAPWTAPGEAGFTLGAVKWNTDQVHAVAIDGQHRLATIKKLVQNRGKSNHSLVPIIFLLFDAQVGFKGAGDTDMTQMMRRIFIDLNKHAKNVSRARQILLDDRDPFSVCARSIIANSLQPDLGSLEEPTPVLPLSLVDWHSEQAKFDKGAYLTTVLGVEYLMSEILGTKRIDDQEAYSKFEQQIGKLAFRLEIDLTEASERLAECREQMRPFSYSEDDLKHISEGFKAVWNEALVYLFTQFLPYEEFIRLRRSSGTVSVEWQWWNKLRQAEADVPQGAKVTEPKIDFDNYVQKLRNSEDGIPVGDFESRLKDLDNFKENNLAFNVVFQRAYFKAFYHFMQFTDADLGELEDWQADQPIDLDPSGDPDEDIADFDRNEDDPALIMGESLELHKELARARQFVKAMNTLVKCCPNLLQTEAKFSVEGEDVYLWSGSIRKAAGGIDFTNTAGTRAADLLFLWATMATQLGEGSGGATFDEFWADLLENPKSAQAFKRMLFAVKRLSSTEKGVARHILVALDQDVTEEACKAEIEKRLRHIWGLVNS